MLPSDCGSQRHILGDSATQQDCLHCLLGDGDKWIEIVYGEKNIFCTGPTRAAKAGQKSLLYRHDKPNEPLKEGPLSFVLFKSPFTSISKVSRGHPSLVSLVDALGKLGGLQRREMGGGGGLERLKRDDPCWQIEVTGDSKGSNERGPSLVGLFYSYKIFLFCLGGSSRPGTKYFWCSLYTI